MDMPAIALRLSYAELGARLGLSTDAARSLARRRRWPRVVGNDGIAVVLVDEAALQPPGRPGSRPQARQGGRPGGDRGGRPPAQPDYAEDQAELWQQFATLKAASTTAMAELLAARERAARAEGEAVALRDALADLATRLDVATAELRELRRLPWWRRLLGGS